MLNVLIAEDNMQISVHLSNMINTTPNVRCIGIVNQGNKVYQKIKSVEPDILILDLRMPGKNGLEILKEIENDKDVKTRIYIYSADLHYISLAREYKCVDKFFTKRTPAEEIARYLEEINNSLSSENTKDKIIDILFRLGFTYSLKGTKIIYDCIYYSITQNEDKVYKLYEYISKKYGDNTHTVKSCVNTAIKNMWRSTDRNKVRKILRLGECDEPSSKDVISMVKYYVAK